MANFRPNQNEYKNMTPFKTWLKYQINTWGLNSFPFVESDFDDLTNYAMMMKLMKHFNVLIENQNMVEEDMTNLYNAFTELQNYVNTYFDEHFPELVNDKLDEMAEDGTLENLLNDLAHLTKSYDTYIEMMEDSEHFTNGLRLMTMGYYEVGDGGNALYQVNIVNNEMSVDLISDVNNVLCHGVKTNDSNNNNHTIIQNVLNTYGYAYCNKPITLHNTLEINNMNKKFVFDEITYDGNGTAIILNSQNIVLIGKRLESTASNGIRLGYTNVTANCNINLNFIKAENNAIIMGGTSGTLNSVFDIGRIEYKNHGIYFDLENSYVGQIALYNSLFADNSELSENYAIYMDCSEHGMTGFDIYNISLEGAKGGIYVTTTGTNTAHFLEHLNIYGCRLAEFSLNNRHKALKLVASGGIMSMEGEWHFDSCRTETFDFSDYLSTNQQNYKFVGKFQDIDYVDYMGSISLIGTEGTFAGNKLIITKPYYDYFAHTISANSYIIPNAKNLILNGTGTAKLKFNPSDFSLNGIYFVYNNSLTITQLDILNNDDTIARSYTNLEGAETFMISCNNFRTQGTTEMNITKFTSDTTRQLEIR